MNDKVKEIRNNKYFKYSVYGISIIIVCTFLWFLFRDIRPNTDSTSINDGFSRTEQYINDSETELDNSKDTVSGIESSIERSKDTATSISDDIDRSAESINRSQEANSNATESVDRAIESNTGVEESIDKSIGQIDKCQSIIAKYTEWC